MTDFLQENDQDAANSTDYQPAGAQYTTPAPSTGDPEKDKKLRNLRKVLSTI